VTSPAVKPVGLYRDQYHRYQWNGDGPLVGVTSVLKLQDVLIGGDLAAWGGRIAIERVARKSYPDLEHAVTDGLSAVSAARDIGTEVHAQIEKILLGQPVSPTERTAPYVYAFSAFLAAERPEFVGVEQRVANMTHRFAGTFDFAANMRGKLALVDVKSGKLKTSHRLQLAAYSAGEFIGIEGDPNPYPIPRFRSHYVLLLKPEGYELVEMEVTPADRKHFLYLVSAYHRIKAWENPT
jgi:hypothetical protein